MKLLTILLIGIALQSGLAFGGLSSDDPMVKKLRDRFANSKIPNAQELHLGKTWVCKEYSANYNEFRKFGPTDLFQFSEFEGIIENNISESHVSYFWFTPTSLQGRITSYEGIIHLRMSDNGDLLGEGTVFRSGKLWELEQAISKINDPSNASLIPYAYSYLYCPAKQLKN